MCLKNRQLYLKTLLLLLLTLSLNTAFAIEENLLNSQLLRMKDKYDPQETINPFLVSEDKKTWGGNLAITGNKDIYNFYKDISSKNQTQIDQRIQQSFGVPYSFFGKTNLYGRIDSNSTTLTQSFHVDAGASFYLTDPVFPEVKTMLFENYGAKSDFGIYSPNIYKLNVAFNYGRLKVLQQNLNVGDLIDSKPSFKLQQIPFKFYLNVDISAQYNLYNVVDVVFKMNSVPLVKQDYELFNSFIGFMTNNILTSDITAVNYIKIYAGYSPFYSGDYSAKRTMVLGSRLSLNNWVDFDLFTTDDLYVGGRVKFGPEYFNATFYTYQESYDDYGIYKFRNYGTSLNFNF